MGGGEGEKKVGEGGNLFLYIIHFVSIPDSACRGEDLSYINHQYWGVMEGGKQSGIYISEIVLRGTYTSSYGSASSWRVFEEYG